MSKQITARVTDQFHEDFFKIGMENGLSTTKEVLEHIFAAYKNSENPVNTGNSEKLTQLENLTENLKHEISELETALNQKQSEPVTKEVIKEIPAQLKENEFIVSPNYKQFFALEITETAINEATGKKLAKAEILLNLFQSSFIQTGDYLHLKDRHRRNYAQNINDYKNKIQQANES